MTVFDDDIKRKLIVLKCGPHTLWEIVIITASRRLEVGLGNFCERGIVYSSDGSRITNSVKRIFRPLKGPNTSEKNTKHHNNILGVSSGP